jgi:hypothetical protein
MKSKNLEESKRNLLRAVILPLMVVLLMLGATVKTNAQKYELTGTKSQITQTTEITNMLFMNLMNIKVCHSILNCTNLLMEFFKPEKL